eukprot:5947937-Prorocentrum_lima.AAC.1
MLVDCCRSGGPQGGCPLAPWINRTASSHWWSVCSVRGVATVMVWHTSPSTPVSPRARLVFPGSM